MGSMRLGELSIAGKIFLFILFCGVAAGGYYAYVTIKFNSRIEQGNECLSRGDYENAIKTYNTALEIKPISASNIKITGMINNATILKEAEIAKLKQEITAIIGDKYRGIEGSNIIALKKGYYSAVEIEKVQEKINRLKELEISKEITKQYQQSLDSQKSQLKNKR